MEIRLSKKVAETIGLNAFRWVTKNEDSWKWKRETYVNLAEMSKQELDRFEAIFTERSDVPGVKIILKDIAIWRAALTDGKKTVARAVRHFEPLLTNVLAKMPGHRLYERLDGDRDTWVAYYVNETEYHREEKNRDYTRPAFVSLELVYEEFGGQHKSTVTFWADDCVGLAVTEALARKKLYLETTELREQYLTQVKRFGDLVPAIGKQLLATGFAVDNLDGNPTRSSSWYWTRVNNYQMELNGERRRVVVDVFVENESEREREEKVYLNGYFWAKTTDAAFARALKDEKNEDAEPVEVAEDLGLDALETEVPIHPYLAVFDLKRHLRLRIHVAYVDDYVYDKTIADKLIIPEEQKDLVKTLIHHDKSTFKDIVAGKGGGAVVLLTGPPGVGKTLTAEVYAESEGRALYSVQCSQLGTDPNELEDELLKVFTRAKRWNAVLLLDEADVYVHERGADLAQNAIVGVFLRVLEYQSTVMFLTTNRPDDVDDAIASRCVARLSYVVPNLDDQRRIWRVLADASEIKISDTVITAIAKANTRLTGRDIKNLLKLSSLVANGTGKPITPETINFVKRFKPTGLVEAK